jgi:DNA-binding CsgD family transcriptional regulator
MPLNWQEIVQNYITKYSDRIQKVTAPLRERLDVGYFTYHRISGAEGRYTVLVDRPDWAEHYVNARFYLEDPYLRHPDVYRSGCCSIQSNGAEDYRKRILHDGREIFNLDYSVLLIEKNRDFVEFFGFCASRGTSRLEEVALNCPAFLKAFALYFRKELSSVLQRMQEEAGSLIDLKGADFFKKDPIDPTPRMEALLGELGMGTLTAQLSVLSPQEKKCLQRIGLGKSAKEIALELGLSHRTVESYIDHIRDKTSCSTTRELLTLARELEKFSLLP